MTYKTFFHFALILILVGIWDLSAQEAPVYTREKSYKSLRLTYEDLSTLLLTIQEFLTYSATDTSNILIDEVSVKNKSEELTIPGSYQLDAFKKAPPKATSAKYRFYARKHPIEDVRVYLSDRIRKVEIAGSSSSLVQALSTLIHEHLKAKETFFGAEFRMWGTFLIIITHLSLTGRSLRLSQPHRTEAHEFE